MTTDAEVFFVCSSCGRKRRIAVPFPIPSTGDGALAVALLFAFTVPCIACHHREKNKYRID